MFQGLNVELKPSRHFHDTHHNQGQQGQGQDYHHQVQNVLLPIRTNKGKTLIARCGTLNCLDQTMLGRTFFEGDPIPRARKMMDVSQGCAGHQGFSVIFCTKYSQISYVVQTCLPQVVFVSSNRSLCLFV